MMVDPILEYIEKERNQGFSDKDILKRMTQAGYNEEKVRALLTQPTSQNKQTNKYHAWEVVFAILILLALLTSFFFMATSSLEPVERTNEKQEKELPPKQFTTGEDGISRMIGSKDLNEPGG